ncbi:MAG: hypothetical protein LZF86_110726 [Nitrospira sp.]|nr:MAG: hypothetical protein LZF86_110726 [Nitrospira sp.]
MCEYKLHVCLDGSSERFTLALATLSVSSILTKK